jgi:hypothetical protein
MNEGKIKQLFAAARKETAPVPTEDFAADVLRAIRCEPHAGSSETTSVFDQLNLLFPRLALVSALAIILCAAVDFGLTIAGAPGLGDGVLQISAQWFLTPAGF